MSPIPGVADDEHHREPGLRSRLRRALDVRDIVRGQQGELLGVVGRVEVVLVDRLLPDDRVEVEAALGHARTRRHRGVALRVHEDVALLVRFGVEEARHEHRRPAEGRPRLPVVLREAEEVAGRPDADHVDAERLPQVGRDLAEHLEGLGDLHRRPRRIEAERLPEQVDGVDVHPRRRGGAEVERHPVGLGVRERGVDPLARGHGPGVGRDGRHALGL